MALKSVMFCLFVVMTTVVRCSCGTNNYCGEKNTTVVCQNMMEQNNYLLQEIRRLGEKISKEWAKNNCKKECIFKNCAEVYRAGNTQSGVYSVKPNGTAESVDVYCDHSNGGGWTVFQRRMDGSVLFNRTWLEYKYGFGNLRTEFWLGNDVLSLMSMETENTLRVDLQAFNGDTAWAQYTNFKVQPENQNYKLEFGTYSGTAGNLPWGLSYQRNMQFSTIDRDNDRWSGNCATHVIQGGGGGWWYNVCIAVNLNGYYNPHVPPGSRRRYIIWYEWKKEENLQKATMRFRPSNF